MLLETDKDKTGGTSKYVGVSFNSRCNRYVSRCYHNGKQVHIGYFICEVEARDAYNNFLNSITNNDLL